MNKRSTGLEFAGTVFGIVTALHVLRLLTHFNLRIGRRKIPLWVNGVGGLISGAMSVWMWLLSSE